MTEHSPALMPAYEIVELKCEIPVMPGQWTGRLADGRTIRLRNDTFEATIEVETVGGPSMTTLYRDFIYRGLAIHNDAIAVSVMCTNADVRLSCPKVEGMA
jgi:hypothetical protein